MNILLTALATASITIIVTKSSLFRPVRFLKVMQCPFCFSVWCAFALVIVGRLLPGFLLLIDVFAIVALAAIIMLPLLFLLKVTDH